MGEGEITTYELLKTILNKKKDYAEINGLAYLMSPGI